MTPRLLAAVWAVAVLTSAEPIPARAQAPKPPAKPDPDVRDAKYGPHERNVLDLWKAKADRPTPVVVYIHGGGFRGGDKSSLAPGLLKRCLDAGISVAAINYRLSQHAPFPAPMLDGGRAVQFLRSKAKEWNLDPNRVAGTGGSAGAGISLWLAFRDDLADPKAEDPVARQSTRLACAAVQGAQSSYDPRWIKKEIGGRAHEHPALMPFYGLKEDELDTPKAHMLYEAASPMTYVSKGDPPVFLVYAEPKGPLPADAKPGQGIHHPKFGAALKAKLDPLGIECVVRHRDEYNGQPDPADALHREMVGFFRKHLADRPKGGEDRRKGTVTGVVTAKGENWIEVKADGEEKARRYVPHWRGGAPAQGGGPDKEMVARIKEVPVKSRVRLEWVFEERPRVETIEVLKPGGEKK
jgi:acetyl esterase/lipase